MRYAPLRANFLKDPIRVLLTLLYIGLIEGIDAEKIPCHGSRKFPEDKLSAQIVAVAKPQPNDRLPSPLKRLDMPICSGVYVAVQPEIDEEAVLPIDSRRAHRFPCDGDQPPVFLAGAFGQ